jgi:hypothetical protein
MAATAGDSDNSGAVTASTQPRAVCRKAGEIRMNAQRCYLIIVLLGLRRRFAGVHRVTAQTGVSPPSMETNMPSDIDPQSIPATFAQA